MGRHCTAIGCVLVFLAVPTLALSSDATRPLRRIAFGSCAHQDRPQPIWDAVVASKPDLFLFIGDIIYADTRDMDVMKAKYAKLAAIPGYQKLVKACPIHAVWDDHDYGMNDAGAEYPKRVESQKIFLDFFKEPKDSPRWTRPGLYDARIYGPPGKQLQVILLDTRYFRSPLKKRANSNLYDPNNDPAATMLGEDQWRWLRGQLRIPAQMRLIVSTIQVVPEDHGYEKWMNFPHERQRLFDLIRDTKAAGAIFLSGDRHLAELSQMDAGTGYPIFDLTSSGLNQASKHWRRAEVNRHRVMTMSDGDNFGVINIDWDRADPLIGLQIRDAEGDVTIQQKLPLSLLQPVELPPGGIATPAQAAKLANQTITVEMQVQSTGESKGNSRVFLNALKNFRAAENFTVVLEREVLEKLRSEKIEDARAHFQGKTIRVTGTVAMYNDRPEILVKDPRQIRIVDK